MLDVTNSEAKDLSEAIEELVSLESKVSALEEELKAAKEKLRIQSEEIVPALMAELGLAEIKDNEGHKITVKPIYRGTATPEALKWLKQEGFEDIIKAEINVPFGRGALKEEEFEKIVQGLEKMKVKFSIDETVHHSTLSAFLKEQITAGTAVPLEDFKAFIGSKAIVK